jgi:hypothetical protein
MNHVREFFYRHATDIIVPDSKREIVFLQEIKMVVNSFLKAFAKTRLA